MASYRQVLQKAKKMTRLKGKETSATDLLLLHFCNLQATDLYLNYELQMPDRDEQAFFQGLEQYLEKNIPVQQIIGYVYFYGHKFIVSNQALIPRFETEELVANVLMIYDEYFDGKEIKLVDIGTGSGCLAVTIAKEEKQIDVSATDISEEALMLAKENADALDVHVSFYQGDMLKPVINEKFDILVSNPPYIPSLEVVDKLILDNEPHIALFGGLDGLKYIHEIIEESDKVLNEQAIIAFEHAYDKAKEIRAIAKNKYPDANIYTLKDMQNLDRMTFIIIGF